ncbi:MAG: cytochrome C oxidase subunit IV family protein [Bacteroidetes bacterium]|nr:cytochrome C oxidase subunit IV family protein [Bacteroidota bacterium]
MATTTGDGGAETRKAIYRTALILTALTVLEFIIAFTKHTYAGILGINESTAQTLVVITFVILTIFKAFYIVAEFMHLKHEIRKLALTILVPFIFIVWLLIGMILEGGYWGSQDAKSSMNNQTYPSEEVFVG